MTVGGDESSANSVRRPEYRVTHKYNKNTGLWESCGGNALTTNCWVAEPSDSSTLGYEETTEGENPNSGGLRLVVNDATYTKFRVEANIPCDGKGDSGPRLHR